MYIEKVEIKKYRLLENITIRFQSPASSTAYPETGNIVNIVAGVNGCGKTTLLDLIADSNTREGMTAHTLNTRQFNRYEDTPTTDNKVISERKGNKIFWYYPELENISRKEERDKFATEQKNIIYIKFGDLLIEKNKNGIMHDPFQELEDTIVKYLLHLERNSRKPDPKERSKDAISSFNGFFQGAKMNSVLTDFSYGQGRNSPVFKGANGDTFSMSELSHGEKALYQSVLILIRNDFKDCVILIDEPELGMHPAWQQKVIDIFSKIGRNNQFIIATHSPQIIASTQYQNLIVLRREDNNIIPFYPSHPPAGVDANSILSQIMRVEQSLPQDVEELHKQYRKFIETKNEQSSEAMKIKEKLLQRESNDSKFMQEMRLLIRLRG